MEKFKPNKMFLVLGIFLPLIGIAFANIVYDDTKKRSLKMGSALSTIVIVFALSSILIYYVGTQLMAK